MRTSSVRRRRLHMLITLVILFSQFTLSVAQAAPARQDAAPVSAPVTGQTAETELSLAQPQPVQPDRLYLTQRTAQPQTTAPHAWTAPVTDVTGPITTDTIWTLAGSPYRLSGQIRVENGATLTIQAGVVVQAAQDAELRSLAGTRIVAQGSAAQPVRFTADSGSPASDWWRGILFLGADGQPSTSSLAYTIVEYAGRNSLDFFENNWRSPSAGIAAFRWSGSFSHVTVRQTAGDGIWLELPTAAADLSDISLLQNSGVGLVLNNTRLAMPNLARMAASGNGNDNILLTSGETLLDQRWPHAGLAYELGQWTVQDGATLTIGAGAVLRFQADGMLKVAIGGRLMVGGTQDAPVRFTATTANPRPGWWRGLMILGDAARPNLSTFSYLTIEHTGSNTLEYWEHYWRSPKAGVVTFHWNGSMDHVAVQVGSGDGLWLEQSDPTLTDLGLTYHAGRGFVFLGASLPTLTRTQVMYNGRTGFITPDSRPIFADFASGGNQDPTIAIDSGAVTADMTWQTLDAPWAPRQISLNDGVHLTMEPGAALLFDQDGFLRVNPGSRLTALGTADAPIRFSANSLDPAPNWWRGMIILGDPARPNPSVIEHAVIEYAGNNSLDFWENYWRNPTAALIAFRWTGHLTQVSVRHTDGDAVWLENAAASAGLTDLVMADNTGQALTIHDSDRAMPQLVRLSATGNGDNTILLTDGSTGVDQRWVNAGLAYALGSWSVRDGATLIVDPGVELRFAADASLSVEAGGVLHVQGTAEAPVRLTGHTDAPIPAWWRGVRILGDGNRPNLSTFSHAVIEYAGRNTLDYFESYWRSPKASMVAFRWSGGLDHVTIRQGQGDGMWIELSQGPTLDDITLRGFDGRGFVFLNGALPTVNRMTVLDNGRTGWISANSRPIFADFVSGDNTDPTIAIDNGQVVTDTLWQNLDAAWAVGQVTINAGISLTVEAGTRLLFNQDGSLISVPGSRLIALGRADAPIRFSANSSAPAPDWWRGIQLLGDPSRSNRSDLDYAIVEFAGRGTLDYWEGYWRSPAAAIVAMRWSGSLSRTVIQETDGHGLWMEASSPLTVTTLVARNNSGDGVRVVGGSALNLTQSNLFNNGGLNLRNDGVNTVDARNNYWGNKAGPAGTVAGLVNTQPWKLWPVKLFQPTVLIAPEAGGDFVRPGDGVLLTGRDYDCVGVCTVDLYWEFPDVAQLLGSVTITRTSHLTLPVTLPAVFPPGDHEIVGVMVDSNSGEEILRGGGSTPSPFPLLALISDYPAQLTPGDDALITWGVTGTLGMKLDLNRLVWDTVSHENVDDYAHQLLNLKGEVGSTFQAVVPVPADAENVFFRAVLEAGSERYVSLEYGMGEDAPTQVTVGSLTVWADSITGGTCADGNTFVGANGVRWFSVARQSGSCDLTISGGNLTGNGVIAFADGTRRTLWQGPFTGNGGTGQITPGTVVYKLTKLAGLDLKSSGLSLSLDALTGVVSGTGSVHLALPENVLDLTLSAFTLDRNDGVSGAYTAFTLQAAGMTLALAPGTVDRMGLRSPSATLTLPAGMGGGSASLSEVRVTSGGVRFSDALVSLPDIVFGGPGALAGRQINVRIVPNGGNFALTGEGVLHVELPENVLDVPVTFTFQKDGSGTKLSGYTPSLDLTLAGGRLALSGLRVDNNGLYATGAKFTPPRDIALRTTVDVALSDVVITKDGLSIAGGSADFPVPDLALSDQLRMTGLSGRLQVAGSPQRYRLALGGSLHVDLPGVSSEGPVNLTVSTDGSASHVTGTVGALSVELAGGVLTMTNLGLSDTGLTVGSAKLSLPALGIANWTVNTVTIGVDGSLAVGGAGATFPLPAIALGGAGSAFGLSNGVGRLVLADGAYSVQVEGTVTASLPGNSLTATGVITVHSDGSLSGGVNSASLNLAGAITLSWGGAEWGNSAGLVIPTARLQLPPSLGGQAMSVAGLRIGLDGLISFAGGGLRLPDIDTGAFRIGNVQGSINTVMVNGQPTYEIAAQGDFTLRPQFTVGVAFTIVGSQSGVILRQLCGDYWSGGLGLPVVSPVLYANGFGVCGDFTPTDVSFTLTVYLTSPVKGLGVSLLAGEASVTVRPYNNPLILFGGQLSLLNGIATVDASGVLNVAPFRFSVSGQMQAMGGAIEGQLLFNIWYDRYVHASGSAGVTVHLDRISGFPNIPFIPQTLGAQVQAGEFYHGDRSLWGVKGIVVWGSLQAYIQATTGGTQVGLGAGDTVLAQPPRLSTLAASDMDAPLILDNGLLYSRRTDPSVGERALATDSYTRTLSRTTPTFVELTWSGGEPGLALFRPDGSRVITGTGVTSQRGAGYESWLLDSTTPGDWRFEVGKLAGGEGYQLAITSMLTRVTLASASVSDGPTPTATWSLTPGENDPILSLWADTDAEGYDGVLLADNATGSSQELDMAWLPAGVYHLYLVLDDGLAGLDRRYATGTVTVVNSAPPATPAWMTARATAQGMEIAWIAPLDRDLGGYEIGYAPDFTRIITPGLVSEDGAGMVRFALSLAPEESAQVAVRTFDTSGNHSPWSSPVTATAAAFAVQSLSPRQGESGVSVGGSFTVTFSAPLDPDSAVARNLRLLDASGVSLALTVVPLAGDLGMVGMVGTPVAPLTPGSSYTLTVAGGLGGVRSATGKSLGDSLTVSFVTAAPVPVAAFTAPATLKTGADFTPVNTSTASGPVTYRWEMGDGTVYTGDAPFHRYTQAGAYTVSLTATGVGGTATASRTVTVSDPAALLSLVKSGQMAVDADASGDLSPGDTVVWTLTLHNGGDGALTGWTLTDLLDSHTSAEANSAATDRGTVGVVGSTLTVAAQALLPGDTATIRVRAIVAPGIPTTVTAIVNQATVSGTGVSGPVNSNTVSLPLSHHAAPEQRIYLPLLSR